VVAEQLFGKEVAAFGEWAIMAFKGCFYIGGYPVPKIKPDKATVSRFPYFFLVIAQELAGLCKAV